MDQSSRLTASLTEDGRYRLLVEAVTDYAIYMLDPTGFVTSWNPGAQRVKGYSASEIIGQHFSKFYTEEDLSTNLPQRALATAAKEGKFEAEGWRVRKDGTRFWAFVVIDPIRSSTGELVGFAKVTRDLTERKQAQDDLEKARVALFQSQKMDALGQLTGGVAHDFNNLLMAVLCSLELMRKRLSSDPKLLALLENAVQGAQRGKLLTERMLAFARRQELKQSAIDIRSLVLELGDFLERSIGPSIVIENRFPVVVSKAMVDPNQLELALLNLVVNARDAMPEGGRIVIGVREEDRVFDDDVQGAFVCLSVADTGGGMDAATMRRATEPFFTTKGPGKGTGLGLPMVHGIAEQSGGKLVLRSREGEGTTAEIWLPVAPTESPTEESPAADLPQPSEHLVVLAVDDDALILLNTQAMLEDLGHTAVAVSGGGEALAVLGQRDDIDVVVTDQAMPHMTGLMLAAIIKERWPKLPVVIATGYAQMEPGTAGNWLKLSKPYTEGDLARVLAAVSASPPPARRPTVC
jgi:PAS domain S-box-containing protein